MTTVEKQVLIVLCAAFLLGTGLLVARRVSSSRMAAAGGPMITGTVEAVDNTGGPQININTARQYELEALPGIGPVLAARIIAYREKHGLFSSVEQLRRVSGIGPKRYELLRDMVVVELPGQ